MTKLRVVTTASSQITLMTTYKTQHDTYKTKLKRLSMSLNINTISLNTHIDMTHNKKKEKKGVCDQSYLTNADR